MGRKLNEAVARLAEVQDGVTDSQAKEAVGAVIAARVAERFTHDDEVNQLAEVIATALKGRRASGSTPKLSEQEVIAEAIRASGLL